MAGVLDFWLERGIDGFRVDVAHGLGKPAGLPDVPAELAEIPYSALNDDDSTHPILRHLRAHVDRWPQRPVLVGEVFLIDTERVAKYYGHGDELHLAFNFTPMFSQFSAASFRRRLEEIEANLVPIGAWPTWVLSNHDRPRHRTRYGGSERRARAAAVLSIGMRGTVFLYQGEELGLEDAEIPVDLVVDPGGRDGCRALIPWAPGAEHGWALDGASPWLPFSPHPDELNVESESACEGSMLSLYRRLIEFRRRSSAVLHGDLEVADVGSDEVLAFRRLPVSPLDGEVVVLVNFSDVVRAVSGDGLAGSWQVEVGSGGDGALTSEREIFGGRLGPEEAVILSR